MWHVSENSGFMGPPVEECEHQGYYSKLQLKPLKIYICVCLCACMYVRVYVYMCVHIYLNIYVYIFKLN